LGIAPRRLVERALADIERQESTLLVLHDVSNSGATAFLSDFLDQLEKRHIPIVQEFPDECLLIKSGQASKAPMPTRV
jgi:peptidoglycan-N-acetylglucosamine deacetylase